MAARADQEALVPQSFVPVPGESNSVSWSCDCLAHRFGNASVHQDGVRCYPSDRTDAEWAAIRPLLPVPAWFQEQGGRPEGYCHRQLPDAIRYLVAGGFTGRALPTDFPGWGGVYAFFRRWREHGLITELHDRLRGKVREREGREAEPQRESSTRSRCGSPRRFRPPHAATTAARRCRAASGTS
ncbi:transposase [Streptomyces noursei]|uniref:transposase n=1 Tax=Streptomyces noursei TaxID=1971 RepID=UPI0035E342C4